MSDSVEPEKIVQLRAIVANGQYAKVDGQAVDLFTAATIVAVYDALNEANKLRYLGFPLETMAAMGSQAERVVSGHDNP